LIPAKFKAPATETRREVSGKYRGKKLQKVQREIKKYAPNFNAISKLRIKRKQLIEQIKEINKKIKATPLGKRKDLIKERVKLSGDLAFAEQMLGLPLHKKYDFRKK